MYGIRRWTTRKTSKVLLHACKLSIFHWALNEELFISVQMPAIIHFSEPVIIILIDKKLTHIGIWNTIGNLHTCIYQAIALMCSSTKIGVSSSSSEYDLNISCSRETDSNKACLQ